VGGDMSITEKLSKIQSELVAPKNQYNNFGKYSYRSCEDIVEAVKPLLLKEGMTLLLSDDIVEIGGRVYVKAMAAVSLKEDNIRVEAFAREPETQKGMAEPQITGSASSYARKYALNGLFAIDDTKDADAMKPEKEEKKPQPKKPEPTFLEKMELAYKAVGKDYYFDCLTAYKAEKAEDVKEKDQEEILADLRKQATKLAEEKKEK
jgi:hypothetical protein